MVQIVNPITGSAFDVDVMVCREKRDDRGVVSAWPGFAEVLVRSEGRVVRSDYGNLRWISPDWYARAARAGS